MIIAEIVVYRINKYGQSNPDMAKMEASRQNLGKKLSHTQSASIEKNKRSAQKNDLIDPKTLKVGTKVHVISLNLDGTVHSLPNSKGDLVVTMGIMQSKINIKDITLAEDVEDYAPKPVKRRSNSAYSKAASISPEVMLIGMTTDEALRVLDKYLDDARLARLESVRVVHGKGTGALRKAVSEYLRKQPVSGYHIAEYGEGDSGVTIVEL